MQGGRENWYTMMHMTQPRHYFRPSDGISDDEVADELIALLDAQEEPAAAAQGRDAAAAAPSSNAEPSAARVCGVNDLRKARLFRS